MFEKSLRIRFGLARLVLTGTASERLNSCRSQRRQRQHPDGWSTANIRRRYSSSPTVMVAVTLATVATFPVVYYALRNECRRELEANLIESVECMHWGKDAMCVRAFGLGHKETDIVSPEVPRRRSLLRLSTAAAAS